MARKETGLLVIFGTRPEAIKIAPVVAELRELGVEPYLVCSSQHTDLLAGTPAETDLANAKSLGVPNDGSVIRFRYKLNGHLQLLLNKHVKPQVVVVQGDTSTAIEAAETAANRGLPVAHVEAGIRSYAPEPWPEELNRRRIDEIAKYYFCATETNRSNLKRESLDVSKAHITGNSGVSALWRYAPCAAQLEYETTSHIVITLHRHEIKKPTAGAKLGLAIGHEILKRPELQFFWPIHPAMRPYLNLDTLGKLRNLTLSEPVPYKPFVELVARAKGVITDSGGLVEDCATLGTPCAILRDFNDRPEACDTGQAAHFPLVGGCVERALGWIATAERRPGPTFGTADSARQIATHLAGLLK